MLKTMAIDELEVGMYVKDVICAASQAKVKTQGVVKSRGIIKQLINQGVTQVVVEFDQEDEPEKQVEEEVVEDKAEKKKVRSVAQEFSRSCQIYDAANEQIRRAFADVANGQRLNAEAITELANEITESVERNEYAMAILTRIRNQSTYLWEHAINSAVLMCGFGLYLGINKETLKTMTLGALLHDVGAAKVPSGITNKPGKLTQNERQAMQKHVAWGYNICKQDGFDHKVIVEMVVNHHERLDGSGYPRGLQEEKLSKLAKMIAIVDVYDAMTGDKAHKEGEQPINALRYLLGKKEHYDQALVQQFIKYMGVHPVGSLVKLASNKLAVVIQGNREEPLKPKIKTFYSLKHSHYLTAAECDLTDSDDSIVASVRPEDYDINLSRVIRDVIF